MRLLTELNVLVVKQKHRQLPVNTAMGFLEFFQTVNRLAPGQRRTVGTVFAQIQQIVWIPNPVLYLSFTSDFDVVNLIDLPRTFESQGNAHEWFQIENCRWQRVRSL